MLLAVNLQVDNCVWFASIQQKTPGSRHSAPAIWLRWFPGEVMQMPGMKMPMPGDGRHQHQH